jgi:CheY-like chemotaxis protein
MAHFQLPQQRKTILIADDHIDTIETLRAFLPCRDYDVSIALDGRRALEVAQARLPNYLLLDINLPKMTGFEVSQMLRQSHRFEDSIIIGYSGYGGEQYYDRARASGMDFYVLKPADPDILISIISPEKSPEILATNSVINRGRVAANTCELLLKAQALSVRSVKIVNAAREGVLLSKKGRASRRLKKQKSEEY